MIMMLFEIIAGLVILGVMWWAGQQLLAIVAPYIGEPFLTLIRIVLVIALVLIVLYFAYQLLQMSGVATMGGGTLPKLHG